MVSGGSDCGTSPTMATPRSARPSSPDQQRGDDHRRHRPGLGATSAALGFTPRASRSGFSPLRTQNRNPVAATPIQRDRVDVAQMRSA
jgi:hypothetical protein